MIARWELEGERRELLALCRSLSRDEWETPSLLEGWRVRDVVAHIVGNDHDLGNVLKTRGDLDAANALAVEVRRAWPVEQLVEELATLVPVRGVARAFAGALLIDNWIHHEDIRRPLNKTRPQNPARVRWILRASRFAPYAHADGVTLVATDLDLALGRGPAVYGTAADLIMAMTGRPGQLARVDGPGAPRLAA